MIDTLISFFKIEYFGVPLGVYLALTFSIVIFFFIGYLIGQTKSKKDVKETVKKERKDALNRSRAIIKGQVTEQIAAFLPDFPAKSSEVRFIGKPLDFIAFNGLDKGFIQDISFIEVKTGNSDLNLVERSLKAAVQSKRVKYIEYRIDSDSNNENEAESFLA